MTESDYLASESPAAMIAHLREQRLITDRQCRLWVEACWETEWNLPLREWEEHLDDPGFLQNAVLAWSNWPAEKSHMLRRAHLLREVVGNPWRPVTAGHLVTAAADMSARALESGASEEWIPACWLTPDVHRIAEVIYQSRAWHNTPILADACEEAGCEVEELLRHLRGEELVIKKMVPCNLASRAEDVEIWIPLRGEHAVGCWAVEMCRGQ